MRSFDAFVLWIEWFASLTDDMPAGFPWLGWRAATLARQAGACDHLITAALVHDFAENLGRLDGGRNVGSSADVLAGLFSEHVIGPVRLLPDIAAFDGVRASAMPAQPEIALTRRLRRWVHGARVDPAGPLMPIRSLLQIARRVSLDDA